MSKDYPYPAQDETKLDALGIKIERVRAALHELLDSPHTLASSLTLREATAIGSGAVTALRLIDREVSAESVTLRIHETADKP